MNNTFIQSGSKEDIQDVSMTSNESEIIDLHKRLSPENVTVRKKAAEDFEHCLLKEFRAFQDSTLSMLEKWFTKQDEKFSRFLDEFESIKSSIVFVNKQYDDLNKKTEHIGAQISTMAVRLNQVEQQKLEITQLELKLDSMEQQARQSNLEINNLPEKRNENLIGIIQTIGSTIKQPITPQDILAIHRVPHANPKSTRPKNVVVKLSSRVLRDNFISAARSVKGITTDQINIPGLPQRVYINEHLTLKNKKLFRETREVARQKGLKFVWVKHGTILLRATETAPIFAVRNEEDISKLKVRPV